MTLHAAGAWGGPLRPQPAVHLRGCQGFVAAGVFVVRWPRFQTSRHLRCVFHGLRAPSVLGSHLPHPGVQERGPCPGPGLQRGPSREDAVSLRPATPRLWRFRPWPHAECRFHRDRRRLGPEKNSVWHVSAADSHVGKTFLKMFISANVHSQIRSIFAGARSTVFQSRWACVTARGTRHSRRTWAGQAAALPAWTYG